jgi:hypothetical protein
MEKTLNQNSSDTSLTLSLIKWWATICIIIATGSRAFELHAIDLVFGWIGTAMWLLASIRMQDRPLLVVNIVCLSFISYGLVRIFV